MADSFITLADGDGFSTFCGAAHYDSTFSTPLGLSLNNSQVDTSSNFLSRPQTAEELCPIFWNMKGVKLNYTADDSYNYIQDGIGTFELDEVEVLYSDVSQNQNEYNLLVEDGFYLGSDLYQPKSRATTAGFINITDAGARFRFLSPSLGGTNTAQGLYGHGGVVEATYSLGFNFCYPTDCLSRYFNGGSFDGFGLCANSENSRLLEASQMHTSKPFLICTQLLTIIASDTFSGSPPVNNEDGWIVQIGRTDSWANAFNTSNDTHTPVRVTDSSVIRSVTGSDFLSSATFDYNNVSLNGWNCIQRTLTSSVVSSFAPSSTVLDPLVPELLFHTY